MVEDLSLIRDYSFLEKRKNIICGSREYVRKAGKLLVRAGFKIEKLYCDDKIRDSELQNIEKAALPEAFVQRNTEEYNIIYAENDQKQMEQGLKQLDPDGRGHIYTYCGLYLALAVHADKNKHFLKEMACMNDLNTAMGSYDFAAKWLRGIRWVEESGIELILYAMPKTGTQSMKAVLNQYGFEHTYVHFLNLEALLQKQLYTYYDGKISCLAELLEDPEFVKRHYLNHVKDKKLRIITSIREPIARNYSMIFQAIKNWGPYPLVKESKGDFEQGIINYLDFSSASSWDWFDDEIKAVFGIDVFQYPFDREKGYCVIEQGNVEIFLYRLESSKKLGRALGAFLGAENIDMLACHESEKEEYRFVYEQLKGELHIPDKLMSQYYDNEKMKHFYTEEEIADMKNKWK
jgi:hypothetical protein